MNTQQIQSYMVNDPYIRQYYGGVLGRNQIPYLVMDYPKIYIVNTDPTDQPGAHWITLYVDEVAEYFDSLGTIPEQDFKNFLVLNGSKYMYNSKIIQNYNSDLCGQYCLMYSYFRCRGCKFENIIKMYSDNLKLNDVKVKYFYETTK